MKNPAILLPYALSVVALLCIMGLLASHQPDQLLLGARYDVQIVNGFSNNSSLALVIWCGSKDADMGGRALQEGDDYSWTLQTPGWPLMTWVWPEDDSGRIRSDVHCTMKWDSKRKSFYAFLASRDTRRCSPHGMCLWLVKEDGFYFSNDGYYYHKDFTWP